MFLRRVERGHILESYTIAPHGSTFNSRLSRVEHYGTFAGVVRRTPRCLARLFANAGSSLDSQALLRIVDIVSNARTICVCQLTRSQTEGEFYRSGLQRVWGGKVTEVVRG